MPVVKKPKRKYQQGGRVTRIAPDIPSGYSKEEEALIKRRPSGISELRHVMRRLDRMSEEQKDRFFQDATDITPTYMKSPGRQDPEDKERKARGGLIKGSSKTTQKKKGKK